MNIDNPNLINPFGEPLDEELLLGFATVDTSDLEDAILWWDEHASEEWVGALDSDS